MKKSKRQAMVEVVGNISKTIEASQSLILPPVALTSDLLTQEVEKSYDLVDFQTTMALEIFDRTIQENMYKISDKRMEQARAQITEVAAHIFDALDEEDKKLSHIERAENVCLTRLQDAARETFKDNRKEKAMEMYNLMMSIESPEALDHVGELAVSTVKSIIEEAPGTVFNTDEIYHSLAEAAAMFEETNLIAETEEEVAAIAETEAAAIEEVPEFENLIAKLTAKKEAIGEMDLADKTRFYKDMSLLILSEYRHDNDKIMDVFGRFVDDIQPEDMLIFNNVLILALKEGTNIAQEEKDRLLRYYFDLSSMLQISA